MAGEPPKWKRNLVLTLVGLALALVLMVLWACPSGVVYGQEPDANAFADLARNLAMRAEITFLGARRLGTLSSESRSSFIDDAVSRAALLARVEGTRVVFLKDEPGLQAGLREMLEATVQATDVVYELEWRAAGVSFANLAVADAKGVPRFEPLLYTGIERVDSTPPALTSIREAVPLLSIVRLQRGAAPPPASSPPPSRVRVYNFFRTEVAAIEIAAVRNTPRDPYRADVRVTLSPLWHAEGNPVTSRAYWLKSERCLDSLVEASWYSYLPDLQIGTTTKVGGPGLPLWREQRTLGLTVCG